MRKFFVFFENSEEHRFNRFKEEIEKGFDDIEIVGFNIYFVVATSEGLFYGNKKIEIGEKDFCWFLSNATMNFFLIKDVVFFSKLRPQNIWPSERALDYGDKFLAAELFKKLDIQTPNTALVSFKNIDEIIQHLGGFPLVMKKNVSTIGRDVEIVNNVEEVYAFAKNIFSKIEKSMTSASRISFILQELLEESKGFDYRALCLDGEVLGVIERSSQDGNFKANISLGGKARQVPIDDAIEKMCKKIMKEGDIFYAGIDFLKTKRGYLALEINTSAQFKGFEEATGINVAKKIIEKLMK